MTFRLTSASAALLFILALFPGLGQAQTATSPSWVQGFHSRARLLSGGPRGDAWLGGVEIALDPGFKTYWRTPGDSGLPPRFDWSASDNVASVDVKWPPPSRQVDAGGTAYVYHDAVVLPALVKPADPAKPVTLRLTVDYGVCKDICIPAHAELTAAPEADAAQRAALEKALASLPRPQPLGAPGDLSILSVAPSGSDRPGLKVTVRAAEGTKPALFAEGPENWYFSTSEAGPDGAFAVVVEDKPRNASGPVPILLTLVAGERAVETQVMLDGSGQPR